MQINLHRLPDNGSHHLQRNQYYFQERSDQLHYQLTSAYSLLQKYYFANQKIKMYLHVSAYELIGCKLYSSANGNCNFSALVPGNFTQTDFWALGL